VQSSIQVGVNGDAVWVKVEGKGSFLNSGNLKEFTREMVNRGYREFVVDLENCAMMDSTFMGTMAGVALRLKELGHGHLHVVHCGERSRNLLTGLGLDQIFDIHSNGSPAPQCEKLEREKANSSATDQKKQVNVDMLDAHQALCDAVPENFSRFKDVLDYLKQDLHHETPSN
jgi:anti-sigma B factor antagonist